MIVIDIEAKSLRCVPPDKQRDRDFKTRRDAIVFANKLIHKGFRLLSQTDTTYNISDTVELRK